MLGTKYDCIAEKNSKEIRYKGHYIWRASTNSSGIKYFSFTNSGTVRAGTLQGIKKLITEYK